MAQENQRRRDNARGVAAVQDGARLQLIETAGFPDYALLDSGGGRKLERFGPIVVDRPEPQALWTPAHLSASGGMRTRYSPATTRRTRVVGASTSRCRRAGR